MGSGICASGTLGTVCISQGRIETEVHHEPSVQVRPSRVSNVSCSHLALLVLPDLAALQHLNKANPHFCKSWGDTPRGQSALRSGSEFELYKEVSVECALTTANPAYPLCIALPNYHSGYLEHDFPSSTDTVSVQELIAPAAIRRDRPGPSNAKARTLVHCARPLFETSKFHARLLSGFRAISSLCTSHQGQTDIRNCFFSPSRQQPAEIRIKFLKTRRPLFVD
jgi:hypothetical protein